MANRLKMATVQAIVALKQRGWSNRRIGRELGIRRETVSRYIDLAQEDSKPATNAPPGSAAEQRAECENGKAGRSGPASQCEPFRQVIEEKLGQDLSAQRIYQDLVGEYGFAGSYYSVRRFVRQLGRSQPLPFRRLECAPGEQAQVDFGAGAPVIGPDGKRRKTHVLRIVLSHSRRGYSESTFRQTTEDFIGCLENSFWYFGGVPRTIVIDNLSAAVSKADWFDPELHPRLQSFCKHYGTVILPTRPYTPRHKGKIENGIGYVKDNALKGRDFDSLAEQNRYLLHWEQHVADTRIHGTTRQQVIMVFEQSERQALLPLPASRFPFFREAKRSVHRDGHIEVDKSYYSVPPEYLTREVWARWDRHLVRIFNSRMEQIALHAKAEPGQFRTRQQDIHPHKISGIERGTTWLLSQVSLIGPHATHWAQAMLQQRGIQGIRVLQGLLSLRHRHPSQSIDQACELALSHQAFRLRTIRQIVKRGGSKQKQFAFIDEHPIIRPLSDYGQIVRDALQHAPVALSKA